MAYGVKYTINYKRRSNGLTTIDILESGYTGSITELRGNVDCLQINFTGNMENIYEPTRGSGAQLKLLVSPLTVLDLFTDEPQKFIMKVYNGTRTTGTLIFQGFLPCGIYNEDYSTTDMVEIQLICNDGMGVLDDISFKVSETGATYSGIKTIGEILTIILGKINLTINKIIMVSNLQLPDNSTNIFTNISVMCENFYDEQGKSMSLREVLTSILEPLGLVMLFRSDTIYFIDPISLNDGTAKQYTMSYGSETSITFGGKLDITDGDLTYYETGQQIDIIKPWNSVEINYDPYTWLSDGYNFSQVGNFLTGATTWGWYNYSGDTRPDWKGDYSLTSGLTAKDWVFRDWLAPLWGVRELMSGATEPGDAIYYLQRNAWGNQDGVYTYTFPGSYIKQDDQLQLEINMEVFMNTRHYYNIINPTERSVPLASCRLTNIVVRIGNNYWNDDTGQWQGSEHYCKILVRQLDAEIIQTVQTRHKTWFRKAKWYKGYDTSEIADTWITCKMYVPISEAACQNIGLLSGPITLTIYRGCDIVDIVAPLVSSWAVPRDSKTILVKSIGVAVCDTQKMDIANDGITTTTSLIGSSTRRKSPLSIKLTNGIGVYGSSRGAYSSVTTTPSGINLTGLKRSGDSGLHTTNQLLGQNLVSQYRNQRIKMSGNYDVTSKLLDIQFYLIQDSNYLTGKNFYIVNGTYYDEQESIKMDMIEIVQTREAII